MFPYTSPPRCLTGAPRQPSAVSSDEGPYSKGSKETGTSDQSHLSHRRSFSGTNHAALTLCKSAFSLSLVRFYFYSTDAALPNILKEESNCLKEVFYFSSPLHALHAWTFFLSRCVLFNVRIRGRKTLVRHTCHLH